MVLTEKMVHFSGPDYETGGYVDEYTYNDKEIKENDYKSRLNSWLAEIAVPLFVFEDYDNAVYKKFIGDYAISYEEAIALLKQ